MVKQAERQDMMPVIPPRKNTNKQRDYDKHLYKIRHLVEYAFLYIKQWCGITTDYENIRMIYISNMHTKSRLKIDDPVNHCKLKHKCISYALTAAILPTTATVWALGINSGQDITFGASDNIVTVTVSGDLQVQSLVIFDELASQKNTDNNTLTNSSGLYINRIILSNSTVSISELQNTWRFITIWINTSSKSKVDGISTVYSHGNSMFLPTEEIVVNNYYEVPQYEKRRLLLKWTNQSGKMEFKASSPIADDKLHITSVSITGFLKR